MLHMPHPTLSRVEMWRVHCGYRVVVGYSRQRAQIIDDLVHDVLARKGVLLLGIALILALSQAAGALAELACEQTQSRYIERFPYAKAPGLLSLLEVIVRVAKDALVLCVTLQSCVWTS